MKFAKRVFALELKDKSAIGLQKLHISQLQRFSILVDKSNGLTDFDVLLIKELDELNELLRQTSPLSKVYRVNLDEMSVEQLEELQSRIEEMPQTVNYRLEVAKEFMRRKSASQ